MKVMILGGSFSPPTAAHEAMIASALAMPEFDEVWVMPSGDRPDKTITLTDEDRIRMLERVKAKNFGGDPRLVISNFELRLPRPTQTSYTFEALKQKFPGSEFWFGLGRDSYITMPEWPDGGSLRDQLDMVVFCSGDGPDVKAPNVTVRDIGTDYAEVSSSEVRQRLHEGEKIDGLVSPAVQDYLLKL